MRLKINLSVSSRTFNTLILMAIFFASASWLGYEPKPEPEIASRELPAGCVSQPINGKQYYQRGSNYYLAVYQEGTLVYVTAEPPS